MLAILRFGLPGAGWPSAFLRTGVFAGNQADEPWFSHMFQSRRQVLKGSWQKRRPTGWSGRPASPLASDCSIMPAVDTSALRPDANGAPGPPSLRHDRRVCNADSGPAAPGRHGCKQGCFQPPRLRGVAWVGVPDSAIMRQGRWYSSVKVAQYTRGESARWLK